MPIRTATAADIPRLAELLGLLFSQEEEFFADPVAQAEGLRHIIADPAVGTILLAHEDGKILGMANILFTVSTFLGGRVAILEDLIIDPSARGRGLGSALLDATIALAREGRYRRITLVTDRGNSTARSLYRKRGFAESTMVPHTLFLE